MSCICEYCNYSTSIKCNYMKHLTTVAHLQNVKREEFKCDYCNYSTNVRCNYDKHLKTSFHKRMIKLNDLDDDDDLKQEISELKTKIDNYENQNKHLLEQNSKYLDLFAEYVKNNKVSGTTYISNISVKNYLQQNYSDAPALEGLPDYTRIKYDNYDCEEDDENGDSNINNDNSLNDDEFAETLTYHYSNNSLYKFLGDFIILYYKKKDPKQQSMWSSDISRLTYIIKELLANQKTMWAHDYKGTKTKICVINPLLRYIKEYIDEYWINKIETYKHAKLHDFNKYHRIYTTLYEIKKSIENDVLGNDIIKYIAPYFYMDRHTKN